MFDNPFLVIAMFFWLSYAPIAVLSIFRIFKNHKVFVEKDLRRIQNDPNIIFQITTRSATKTPVVRRGIQSIVSSAHRTNFFNFEISVVTDDPEDYGTLKNERCEIIEVAKDFQTNAIKKGRALQFAVEHRRCSGKDTKKYWIFHMDDESYVIPQTILALLKFIREEKGIASEGPIFYPLKFESANRLTAIAESIRPFACYDCVSQMTHPPPLHMHGSNLLIRSDVEDDIGWNFGPTLAEDQMFGFKVYERYGRESMGWHGGILLEQPPLNLRDHFFQRRRWILGTMQNLQKFPRLHKYKLMFKSITYFLGFASAVASAAFSVYNYLPMLLSPSLLDYNIISMKNSLSNLSLASITQSFSNMTPFEVTIAPIMLFTTLVWLSSYQMGLFLNLRYSKIRWAKRLLLHLETLFFSPIIGLVETFPAFWATIEYLVKNHKSIEKAPIYDFYVINK